MPPRVRLSGAGLLYDSEDTMDTSPISLAHALRATLGSARSGRLVSAPLIGGDGATGSRVLVYAPGIVDGLGHDERSLLTWRWDARARTMANGEPAIPHAVQMLSLGLDIRPGDGTPIGAEIERAWRLHGPHGERPQAAPHPATSLTSPPPRHNTAIVPELSQEIVTAEMADAFAHAGLATLRTLAATHPDGIQFGMGELHDLVTALSSAITAFTPPGGSSQVEVIINGGTDPDRSDGTPGTGRWVRAEGAMEPALTALLEAIVEAFAPDAYIQIAGTPSARGLRMEMRFEVSDLSMHERAAARRAFTDWCATLPAGRRRAIDAALTSH